MSVDCAVSYLLKSSFLAGETGADSTAGETDADSTTGETDADSTSVNYLLIWNYFL